MNQPHPLFYFTSNFGLSIVGGHMRPLLLITLVIVYSQLTQWKLELSSQCENRKNSQKPYTGLNLNLTLSTHYLPFVCIRYICQQKKGRQRRRTTFTLFVMSLACMHARSELFRCGGGKKSLVSTVYACAKFYPKRSNPLHARIFPYYSSVNDVKPPPPYN